MVLIARLLLRIYIDLLWLNAYSFFHSFVAVDRTRSVSSKRGLNMKAGGTDAFRVVTENLSTKNTLSQIQKSGHFVCS